MPVSKRDGVALYYETAGAQGPERPIVLVHGLGGSIQAMRPQLDYFAQRHHVVAVDLRGHGKSDKPEQGYAIAAMAEDVEWLVRDLALDEPVLIGHSMGGAISLELAATRPDLIGATVLLDTAVLPTPEAWAGIKPFLSKLRSPDFKTIARQFFSDAFFLPSSDPDLRKAVLDEMLATPLPILASAFEEIFLWKGEAALRRCEVPCLYIGATKPRGDIPRMAEINPRLVCGQVIESGHFLQLEVPDQVNAMIARFIDIDCR